MPAGYRTAAPTVSVRASRIVSVRGTADGVAQPASEQSRATVMRKMRLMATFMTKADV